MMDEQLHVVVVGAGIGGLGAALAFSRAGHRVTLVERDDTPMPPTWTARSTGAAPAPPRSATRTPSSAWRGRSCAIGSPTSSTPSLTPA